MANDLKIKLDLDVQEFISSLNNAKVKATELLGSLKAGKVDVQVSADTGKAKSEIESLSKSQKAEISVTANTSEAKGQIDGLLASFKEGQASSNSGGGLFGGIASQLGALATPAGAATAAIGLVTAGLTKAFSVGADYQTQLAAVGAVTGQSGAALDKIGQSAQDLAAKFGGDVNAQLGAFQGILSKFGGELADTPDSLNKLTDNVNLLAKAGGLDAKQAMDALSGSLQQFGIDAKDPIKLAEESGRFMNALAASAKVGSAEIPEVAAAINVAGGAAKAANLSFEETNSAIQVLADANIKGAQGGTALRNTLALLQKQSGEGEKVLASLGLTTNKLGTDLREGGLNQALTSLKGGLEQIKDPVERGAAVMQLFGTENALAAQKLLDSQGMLVKFTKGIKEDLTSGVDQAAVNMNTFSESISRTSAMINNLFIKAFLAIIPVLNKVTGFVSGVFSEIGAAFGKIDTKNLERAFTVIKTVVAVALSPLIPVIGAIVVSFELLKQGVIGAIEIFANAFNRMYEAFAPIIDPLEKLFNTASSGTPVFEQFQKVVSFLVDVLVGAANLIVDVLVIPIASLVKGVVAAIEWVAKIVKTFADWFVNIGLVKSAFEGVNDGIKFVVAGITGFIKSIEDTYNSVKKFFGLTKEAPKKVETKATVTTENKVDNKQATDKLKEYDALIEKLRGKLSTNTKAQTKEEADAIKEKLKASLTTGAINQAEFKQRSDLLDKFSEKEKKAKKDKEGKDKVLEDAKGALKVAKDTLAIENSKVERLVEGEAKAAGRQLTEEDNLKIQKAQLENLKKFNVEYAKIFDLFSDGKDGFEVGLKIKKDEKETKSAILKEFEDSLGKESKLELKALPKVKPESVKDLIKDLSEASKNTELVIESKASFEVAVQNAIDDLNNKKAKLEIELVTATGDKKKTIETDLKDINKALAENYTIAEQTVFKASIQSRKNALLLIKDEEKKALEEKLIALEEAENKELQAVGLTYEQKLAIVAEYNKKRLELEKGNVLDTQQIINDFVAGLQFDSISFVPDKSVDEAKDKLKDVNKLFEKSKADLQKQLDSGELSYNEYTSKLTDLDKKRIEDSKEANEKIAKDSNKTQKILDVFNKAGANSFKKVEERKREDFQTSSKKYLDSINDQNVTDTQRKALVNQAYSDMAAATGASLAQVLLNGENAGKGALKLALDTLDGLIPIFAAQIFGVTAASPANIGTLGTWGAIQFGLTVGALKGLVAIARSAVGAEDGGLITENYTKRKGRTDTIPMWLAPGEFVVKSDMSKKFRNVLEQINAGTYQFGEMPKMNYDVSHLQNIQFAQPQFVGINNSNYDFARLEQRIDLVNNAVRNVEIAVNEGKLTGSVDVKMRPMAIKGNDLVSVMEKARIKRFKVQ